MGGRGKWRKILVLGSFLGILIRLKQFFTTPWQKLPI